MERVFSISRAMEPFPEKAGKGAALLNLLQFLISALAATVISSIQGYQQLPLAILCILLAPGILLLAYFVKNSAIPFSPKEKLSASKL